MSSFNRVIIMGNLTRDPELRFTPNNMGVCKVGLACNRKFKNKDTGEYVEKPCFVDVTVFGKRGESFEKFHKKGDVAFFEGRLEFDSWDDKESGKKRSKLYVVADNWEFVGSGGKQAGGGGEQKGMYGDAPAGTGYGDDGFPG